MFASQRQRSLEIAVLKGVGHAGDLGGLGAGLLRGLPPGRRYDRNFLDDAARRREAEAVTPAEEVMNFVTADDTGSVEETGRTVEVPPRDTSFDPWQALTQVGAQFVTALAAANDPHAPAHPWIERDPTTGVQSLKIPLPPPETVRQLANALSALADSLRNGPA